MFKDNYDFKIEKNYDLGKLVTFIPNEKLPIYNWFYFKEGFSRDFVMRFIDYFKLKEGDWILDPFLGVGTTLLAAKEKGINGVGIDAAPLAIFVSQVKTADYEINELKEYAKKIFNEKFKKPSLTSINPFIKKAFSKYSLEDIIFFREIIREIEDIKIRNFFTLALMRSAMDVSYAFKNGAVIKIFKKPIPPFRKYFKRIVKRMIKDIEKIKFKKCELNIRLGDARKLDFLEDNFFNAIITSPPYLNKIEYTKVYRIEYELFFGHVKVDPIRSYIGLNLKNVKDIFPELNLPDIAKAYFYDMKMALNEMYRVLKNNGKAAIVVAEGIFPNRIVESDILLAKIAKDIGFKIEKIIIVNERIATRERTIKIGKARESIIILEK